MQHIDSRELLAVELINEYEKMHEGICDNSQKLETKAQINTSIAGIFIAFVFTAIKDLKTVLDQFELLVLFIAFACLIICIGLSLLALFIHFKKENFDSEIMHGLLQNTTKENFHLYINRFYNTLSLNRYLRVNKAIEDNMFKARCVIAAQSFLFGAVISIFTLTYHFLSR